MEADLRLSSYLFSYRKKRLRNNLVLSPALPRARKDTLGTRLIAEMQNGTGSEMT